MNKVKKYYWNEIESNVDGVDDPQVYMLLKKKFNIDFTKEKLIKIIYEG